MGRLGAAAKGGVTRSSVLTYRAVRFYQTSFRIVKKQFKTLTLCSIMVRSGQPSILLNLQAFLRPRGSVFSHMPLKLCCLSVSLYRDNIGSAGNCRGLPRVVVGTLELSLQGPTSDTLRLRGFHPVFVTMEVLVASGLTPTSGMYRSRSVPMQAIPSALSV